MKVYPVFLHRVKHAAKEVQKPWVSAGVLWKPLPCLQTSAEAWIYAGGAHHSVLSYSLTAEHMRDFAEIMGIEFIHINKNTEINSFKKELFYNDVAYKLGM